MTIELINFDGQQKKLITNKVNKIVAHKDNKLKSKFVKFAYLNVNNYCLYNKDGHRINSSGLKRGIHEKFTPDSSDKIEINILNKTNITLKDVVYLGPLFFHYGHFLLESTARLWSLFENFDKNKYIFIFHTRLNISKSPSFLQFFLNYFKDWNIQVFDGNFNHKLISLINVYVPNPAIIADFSINSLFLKPFKFIREKNPDIRISKSSESCYLSRNKLSTNLRKTAGENFLLKLIEDKVDIINPEKLKLSNQINLYNSYSTFIGIIGSAFHNLLFTNSKEIFYITDSNPNINFLAIDILLNNKAHYLNLLDNRNNNILKHRMPNKLNLLHTIEMMSKFEIIDDELKYNKILVAAQENIDIQFNLNENTILKELESSTLFENKISSLLVQNRHLDLNLAILNNQNKYEISDSLLLKILKTPLKFSDLVLLNSILINFEDLNFNIKQLVKSKINLELNLLADSRKYLNSINSIHLKTSYSYIYLKNKINSSNEKYKQNKAN